MLPTNGRGTFLLRNSEQTTGAYSLSVRDWEAQKNDHVKHYKVKVLDNGGFYVTTRKTFSTLQELVTFYKGGKTFLNLKPWINKC